MKTSKFSVFVGVFAFSTIAFLFLSLWIGAGNSISMDNSMNSLMEAMQNPISTILAKYFDIAFDTIPVLIITMALAFLIWKAGKKKEALFLVTIMVVVALIVFASKEMIHSARPYNSLVNGNGFAFPSGHTTGAVALLGSLLYIAWKPLDKRGRVVLSIFFVTSVFSVGFSRVYLNVHWFSDIIGGYMLGIACLGFGIYAFEKIHWKGSKKKRKHYDHRRIKSAYFI
jgi:undecaprenyl-diphosphatase